MDYATQGAALAVRFNATNCPAPAGGYQPIRYATNFPAASVGPLPCVLVLPEEGEFETGNSSRSGPEVWHARFYFAETGTPEKDYKALQLWLSVLVDALKGAVQLAGGVTRAVVAAWRVGSLPYGDKQYSGIDLTLHITATEGWVPTS